MESKQGPNTITRLVELGGQSSSENLSASYFNVHGVITKLVTDTDVVKDAVSSLLDAFSSQESLAHDIEINLFTVNALKNDFTDIPVDASTLYDWDKVKIYSHGSNRYLTIDQNAFVAADVHHCILAGFIEKDCLESDWVISHMIFYPLWCQLMKEKGLYPLHAAGLVKDGRSILLPGRSGSGKSTLSLQLVRDGYGLLSDDTVFLKKSGCMIEAMSFPEEINVKERTFELIPELRNIKNLTVNKLRQKSSFQIDELYPDSFVDSAIPSLIIFPQISDSNETTLQPVSRTEALTMVMCFALFFLDPSTTSKHFEMLSQLVKQAPCYNLSAGSDSDKMLPTINKLFSDITSTK